MARTGQPNTDHDGVGAAEPERAAFQRQRQRMQHRKSGERVGHHQGRGDDLRQDRQQPAGKAQRDGDRQRRERHRRQRRAFQVGPGTVQSSRGRGDFCGEPEIERQRHHGDDRGRRRRDGHQGIDAIARSRRPKPRRSGRRSRSRPRRSAPVMAAASVPRVSRAAIVVSAAKPAIQSRMRPTGYHSRSGATGAAPLPDAAAVGHRPPQQGEMPEPPGRQRDRDDKGDAIGKAEDRAETDRRGNAADGGAERSPSEGRHHQRQRRQVKQQQRDQRARDDRGEHQRRRAAGRHGDENDRDHQLSRSFRAVRGSLEPQPSATGRPGSLMKIFDPRPSAPRIGKLVSE